MDVFKSTFGLTFLIKSSSSPISHNRYKMVELLTNLFDVNDQDQAMEVNDALWDYMGRFTDRRV